MTEYYVDVRYRVEAELREELFYYHRMNSSEPEEYEECIHCQHYRGYANRCRKGIVCLYLAYATKCPYFHSNRGGR